MIYIIEKTDKKDDKKMACIVKANDVMQAKKIAGVHTGTEDEVDFTGKWAGFTDAEVATILSVKEGYIAKDL